MSKKPQPPSSAGNLLEVPKPGGLFPLPPGSGAAGASGSSLKVNQVPTGSATGKKESKFENSNESSTDMEDSKISEQFSVIMVK